jgi:hypothetical protein
MNLFRVNIAAIGKVLPNVPLISLGASFGAGNWYGITDGERVSYWSIEDGEV